MKNLLFLFVLISIIGFVQSETGPKQEHYNKLLDTRPYQNQNKLIRIFNKSNDISFLSSTTET